MLILRLLSSSRPLLGLDCKLMELFVLRPYDQYMETRVKNGDARLQSGHINRPFRFQMVGNFANPFGPMLQKFRACFIMHVDSRVPCFAPHLLSRLHYPVLRNT